MAVDPNGILPQSNCNFNFKVDQVHYFWEINNYRFLDARGEELRSPIFTSATNDKCKWYLSLKPNGELGRKKHMKLSVALARSSECKAVLATFSLFILNRNQKKIHSKEGKKLYKFDLGAIHQWGYPDFILKEELLSEKFLPNDTLTIYFEATFTDVKSNIDMLDQIPSQLGLRILKDDLSEDLEKSFKNLDFTDVVISVNGKRFQAHKFMLTARSPVFAAMFKHDTKESKTNEVEILDIDENVIEEMLYYMYTGKFRKLNELASDLLKAAEKYEMDGMKAKCENMLLKNLSIENAAETLLLADFYYAAELKSKTIKFIALNSTDVMNTETWKNMVISHPHLLNGVSGEFALRSVVHSSQ